MRIKILCIILLRAVSGYFTLNPKKCPADVHSLCAQSRLSLTLVYVVKVFGEGIATREILVFIKCKAFWSWFESINRLSGQAFSPEGSKEMVF